LSCSGLFFSTRRFDISGKEFEIRHSIETCDHLTSDILP
jgi:hypothetical protein